MNDTPRKYQTAAEYTLIFHLLHSLGELVPRMVVGWGWGANLAYARTMCPEPSPHSH